ncbi:MAG: glycosyltransferase family 4 protein [Isosphaeraceae bacterium]|nr:glycosyltransferase family 4 protein [Isosphaeraceae bacterium]
MIPRPRVVHIVPSFFRKEGGVLGGAERYALELARAMAECVPTTLYSFGPTADRYTIDRLDVRIFRTSLHVRSRAGNPLAPSMLAHLGRFDVIHCHQRRMIFSSLSAAAGRLFGRRVFVSDLGGGAWDLSAYVPTERWYHGHLHISQYSRRLIERGDDPRHAVILGGVDTEKFAPDPAVPRGDGVLFVGRLLPHKGVIDLIEGLDTETPLELIGQPYDARYSGDLKAAAAGKRVTFRHDCDDAALVDAYRRARVVVLPSVYEDRYGGKTLVPELLGQTLLEGMACGAPAICTDVASMPEVVEDGVTGFIVPPNDPPALGAKLRWLHAHAEEASRMGEAARRRVLEHFTWDRVVDRCLDAYTGGVWSAQAERSAVP